MNNIKKILTEEDLKVINSFGKVKMVRIFTSIYNRLCPGCKAIVFKNPRDIELTKLCETCQAMIKEKLQKYTE